RVAHERDHLATRDPLDQLAGAAALVVLVIADEPRLDSVARQELASGARVLAGDHVRLAKRAKRSESYVLEVPDRRRADDQPPRLRLILGSHPPLTADRRPRGDRLQAPAVRAVALTARSVLVDDHVAELSAGAPVAAVEAAVQDEAAPDPGPDRQPHDVARTLGGAEPLLDERRHVAVVVHEDRQPEPLLHRIAEAEVLDVEVDRDHRNPGRL